MTFCSSASSQRTKMSLMEHDKIGLSSSPSSGRRVFSSAFPLKVVLLLLPLLTLARLDTYEFDPAFKCSSQGGNFTANSTFATNLNRLISSLSSLPSNAYGFYNASVGETTDEERVNAIGLCRREVFEEDCLSCIQTAATTLRRECLWSKEALVWYTHCMFRYSNRTILGRTDTSPTFALGSSEKITENKHEFARLQRELLDRLKSIAAAGGPNRKYAQGNGSAPVPNETFYAMAQCTLDLSEKDCNNCLVYGFDQNIKSCCDRALGLRWFCPSCNFRIDTWRSYALEADLKPDPQMPATAPLSPSPTHPTNQTTGKDKGNDSFVVTIVIPVVVVVVTMYIACLCFFLKVKKKRQPKQKVEGKEAEDALTAPESLQFDFAAIEAATNNFSSDNQLGKGGFGVVYKGILQDGQEIAVKRLAMNSGQGDNEFKNEVLLAARIRHRNLLRILGFCLHANERLLVYEFIKNTSLDHFIFDLDKRHHLGWGLRYKIVEGVARGLIYLHEDSRYRIIHRDLKPSNILLDEAMNPKIADFGMAKLFETDQTTQRFTNKIAGTYGYMAPEYAMYGRFSVKTDVFSFGVLVLEIISGRRNNGFQNEENVETLLSHTWRNWREGTVLNIIDPTLASGSENEILRCIHIGLLCVQENAGSRPTMAAVVLMLSTHSLTLPAPTPPAFVVESSTGSNFRVIESRPSGSEIKPLCSNNASITELSPR